jgi:hypothetical protein
MEPWCSDCMGSNRCCSEPSSSMSRSPPIDLPRTSQKIGTHPTITFVVLKCDKIFDELLNIKKIKLSHTIPPIEDLKKRAYCKWHNSHSHDTNDCNVFW